MLKLADWARNNGLDCKTAYRLFRSGRFSRPVEQLPTGTILVHELPVKTNNAVLYARVSSGDQGADLDGEMQRLREYAAAQGLHSPRGPRNWLLPERSWQKIDEGSGEPIRFDTRGRHRDRLARFGSEYVESSLKASNRKVIIVTEAEMKDDLVQDMIDVLASFCARLCGKRAAKNKAMRTLEATKR